MEGDWITVAAVLVALGIGVASILHTQSLQKRERDVQRTIQRTKEVQDWILEICNIASSGSPPGDEQERRNRKWRAENVLFLKDAIKVEAKKLDSQFTSGKKLEGIVTELSTIIEEHKKAPEALTDGVKSGKRIGDNIIAMTSEALSFISNIRDKL